MTDAAAQIQPTTPADVPASLGADLAAVDERANALLAKFREEAPAELDGDVDGEAAPAKESDDRRARKEAVKAKSKGGESTADEANGSKLSPATGEPAEQDAAKARDAALERAAAIERESIQQKAHLQHLRKTLGDREAELKAREEKLAARERSFEDPDAILSLLEEKVGAEKLGKWFTDQADPAKRAELAAKRATKDHDARLQKMEDENRKLREELDARERAKANAAERVKVEASFAGRVKEVSTEAPLAARYLEKRPQKAMARAHQIAEELGARGRPYNFDDVIVHMERELREEADVYTDPQPNGSTSTNSKSQHTSPISAAAQATPVTNRAAATRTSISDDDEADLPFEERVRRTERRTRSLR